MSSSEYWKDLTHNEIRAQVVKYMKTLLTQARTRAQGSVGVFAEPLQIVFQRFFECVLGTPPGVQHRGLRRQPQKRHSADAAVCPDLPFRPTEQPRAC